MSDAHRLDYSTTHANSGERTPPSLSRCRPSQKLKSTLTWAFSRGLDRLPWGEWNNEARCKTMSWSPPLASPESSLAIAPCTFSAEFCTPAYRNHATCRDLTSCLRASWPLLISCISIASVLARVGPVFSTRHAALNNGRNLCQAPGTCFPGTRSATTR